MPIDHSSIAFAGSSGETSMEYGVGSYERGQVLSFRSIRIHSSGWCREVINNGLRPNWLSRASHSVMADWRWSLPAHHGACEFTCIAVIQVGGGHVGAHECRPYADGWITGRKGSARCHERQLERQCVNRLTAELMAPTKIFDKMLPRCKTQRAPIWIVQFAIDVCPLPACLHTF